MKIYRKDNVDSKLDEVQIVVIVEASTWQLFHKVAVLGNKQSKLNFLLPNNVQKE